MHFLNCVLSFVLVSCEMLLLVLFLRFVGFFLYSVGFLYDFFLANAYLKKKRSCVFAPQGHHTIKAFKQFN